MNSLVAFPQWDTDLFLFLNGLHADWLDPIMFFISGNFNWVPLYIIIAIFFYRKYGGTRTLFLIAGIALCVLFADRISAGFFKPVFERLRPSREPAIEGLVHTINGYKGGLFGFVSSHAANNFAIIVFTLLVIRNKYYTIGMLFLACLISYSRIYLGVHYPLDIICGTLLGVAVGIGVYYLHQFALRKWMERKERKQKTASS
jgi:undecaprenyl-diphosphatase